MGYPCEWDCLLLENPSPVPNVLHLHIIKNTKSMLTVSHQQYNIRYVGMPPTTPIPCSSTGLSPTKTVPPTKNPDMSKVQCKGGVGKG